MSPRDGLQYLRADAGPVSLEHRIRLIEALLGAGLRHIEIGAYVSPKGTPQMALSDELGKRLTPPPGVEFSALVPNEAGYARFKESHCNVVAVFPTASEAHARKNFGGRSVDDVLSMAATVSNLARSDGYRLRGHVSAAFQDMSVATEKSDLAKIGRASCRERV